MIPPKPDASLNPSKTALPRLLLSTTASKNSKKVTSNKRREAGRRCPHRAAYPNLWPFEAPVDTCSASVSSLALPHEIFPFPALHKKLILPRHSNERPLYMDVIFNCPK